MSELKKELIDLAAVVKAEMKLGEQGVFTASEDVLKKTLEGTDLSVETVQKVQDHLINLVSATGLALGELGTEAMKADSKLDQVSVEFPVIQDTIGGVFQRQKEYPGVNGGDSVTKYGVLTMKYTATAGANKGSLKKVRMRLNELAKESLA